MIRFKSEPNDPFPRSTYSFLHLPTSLTNVLHLLTSPYISLHLLTTPYITFFSQICFLGILLLQNFFEKFFFAKKFSSKKICSSIFIFWKKIFLEIFFQKIYFLIIYFKKNCKIQIHKLKFVERFFANKILKKNSQKVYFE